MGKVPYMYTDSEETEDTSSSVENLKKKKFSLMKYNIGKGKRKKCKVHSISEPDETEFRSRSNQRVHKLRGILKHKDKERESSDEEDDFEPPSPPMFQHKYLVGRVPRVPGSRPGRGGGVAFVIRKNTGLPVLQSLQAQASTSSTRRRRSMKRLSRKRSY